MTSTPEEDVPVDAGDNTDDEENDVNKDETEMSEDDTHHALLDELDSLELLSEEEIAAEREREEAMERRRQEMEERLFKSEQWRFVDHCSDARRPGGTCHQVHRVMKCKFSQPSLIKNMMVNSQGATCNEYLHCPCGQHQLWATRT